MAGESLIDQVQKMSLDDLRQQADEAKAKSDFLHAALALRKGGVRTEVPAKENGSGRLELTVPPNSKRKAVLRLLAEDPGRAWKQSAIKDELVRRGWLDDSKAAAHSLGVTLSKTRERGDIERPKYAHYRITARGMAVET